MKRNLAVAAVLLANVAALAACEEEVAAPPPPPARRNAPIVASSASASASATVAPPSLGEAEFTRSDSNRDPFFSFEFKPTKVDPTVEVKVIALADRFALDDLKLVGIISGATAPKAMFIDPEKKGWIVGYGQFIGRAETVRSGGSAGAEYSLHWKVDRIRDNDVVFIRETPGRPNVPSATKVVSLRTDEQRQPPARR